MIDDYMERPTESNEYEKHGTRTNIPYAHNDVIEPEQPEAIDARQTYQEKKAVVRSYNIIWFFVSIIVALLAFRFVFELLGANPANAFVQFIYALSYPFAGPFRTIFGITNVASSTFDWSIFVAIVVYILIGYALVQLLRIIRPMSRDDVNHRIRTV
jgi:uncharacterized protein YggT (Ycf19 family)